MLKPLYKNGRPETQEQIFTRQAATRRHPTTKHEIELCMDGVRLCLEMEYLCLQAAVHLQINMLLGGRQAEYEAAVNQSMWPESIVLKSLCIYPRRPST